MEPGFALPVTASSLAVGLGHLTALALSEALVHGSSRPVPVDPESLAGSSGWGGLGCPLGGAVSDSCRIWGSFLGRALARSEGSQLPS